MTQQDSISGDMCYTARHPHIAELVVETAFANKEDLFNEVIQAIQYLNPTYSSDRIAFRKLLNGHAVRETFPDHQMAVNLFQTARAMSGDDPKLLQQQAIYEMTRPDGNLTLADSLLNKAHELVKGDRNITHSIAQLLLKKAEVAKHRIEREKYLAEASTICQGLKSRKSDPLPYYTLIKIGIMHIEAIQDDPDAHDQTIENLTRDTERLLEEARVVNAIRHPAIVDIFGANVLPDGRPYLVMELLEGETLDDYLFELEDFGDRMSVFETLRTLDPVARALHTAHSKGIIHRDLKPENLMVVADPVAPRGERIKVLDFGIAKLTETPGVSAADTTRSNLLMGTPRYMSPEQCRGAGKIDAKADVYSLGVLLYQVLAGRLPFVSNAPGELIVMHMTEAPPPLITMAAEVPGAAAALVEQMLAKSAADRPAMADVAQRLQVLLRAVEGRLSGAVAATTGSPTFSGSAAVVPAQPEQQPAPAGVEKFHVYVSALALTVRVVVAAPASGASARPAATRAPAMSAPTVVRPARTCPPGRPGPRHALRRSPGWSFDRVTRSEQRQAHRRCSTTLCPRPDGPDSR